MPYTYEIYDLLVVGIILSGLIGYLAGKGELFKNW